LSLVAKSHLDKTRRQIKNETDRKMWVEEAWTSSLDDFIRIRPEWANASATIQTEIKKEVCFIHQCLFLFIYVAKIYLILKFKF